MNYRQWKKNYKKKYGHNPNIEEIKEIKKLSKAIRNFDFSKSVSDALREVSEKLNKLHQTDVKL